MPSKDGAMDDKKKTTKDVVNKKQKQMMNQEEYLPEEEYDHYKDRMAERGIDISSKDKKDATTSPQPKRKKVKGDTPMQKEFKKKYGKKATALDAVKKDIEDKYGKSAIMEPKKKKKDVKEGAGLYANIHAKRKRGGKMRKKGDKGAPSSQDFANAAKTAKEELDLTKVAEAFGGYVVESLNPSKDELERRLMNRILGGDKRTPAEIDKEIRAARRKEKVDRRTVKKVIRGVQSKAEKRITAPKPGERSAARKVASGFTSKQDTKIDITKPVRDDAGNIVANPPEPTKKEVARKTKEIKDAGRKAFPDAKTADASDVGQFRRQATRQTKLPLVQTKKGVEVGKATRRSAVREKPKVSFKDLKKKIDLKNPTYVSPKSGGKLPIPKSAKGFASPKAAKLGKDAAIKSVTRKLSRRAAGKALVGGAGRFVGKRIPGIGLAISAGEAGARLASGDIAGAALAGAEGIASMIPGIGTLASAGLGAAGVARDVKRAAKVAKVAANVKKAAKGKTAAQIASKKFAKDADKLIKPSFNPIKALQKPVGGEVTSRAGTKIVKGRPKKMMGATTVGGVATRTGGIGMGVEQMRKLGIKKPKVDQGVVGKRTAG